ncbi:MAG: aspartyl protease family protein [Candidatus Baltobacteraceae bacterium]
MNERASRALALVALVFSLAAGASPVRADEELGVAVIRHRILAANGARPATERVTVAYDAFGLHGTRTTFRSGDDFREVENDGPFTTERGSLKGQAWHQNANGQTVLDQPDPGLEAREKLTPALGAISRPVRGYVISTLDARGLGTKEYVDEDSWRIVRRDVITAAATTTYTYDDFRTVDGYTQAWHWTTRDGHPENDGDYRIERYDADPVSEADLAIPPARRNLVEFPPGVTAVPLPVREDRDKFIVRVDVGSRGLDFSLDTGTSGIVLDDSVVAELGLPTFGTFSTAANAGRYQSTLAIVPEMKIGDLTLRNVAVGTIPHISVDRPGQYKTVGLLGFDFFASLVLKMDYANGEVTAFQPSGFVPPQDPLTNALAVRLGSGRPMTDVWVNGAVGERFVVDTGGAVAILIFDYFARRHPEALVDDSGGRFGTGRNYGVGGEFDTQRLRLASVQVGSVNFKEFVADAVVSSGAYGGDEDGLIGTDLLKLYTLYTDYPHDTLYLIPNALGRAGLVR